MLQEQKMEDFYPELQVATEENCKESGKEQKSESGGASGSHRSCQR